MGGRCVAFQPTFDRGFLIGGHGGMLGCSFRRRAALPERERHTDIHAGHFFTVACIIKQAHDAAQAMRSNAELVAKAYSLGESSLSDSLSARRFALESSLAENLAQLDANEARYRLLLDAHQLWPLDTGDDEHHADHY